ncbi:hypothetical protein GBAR_LOCUS7547, partial [Geodia barretti]
MEIRWKWVLPHPLRAEVTATDLRLLSKYPHNEAQ